MPRLPFLLVPLALGMARTVSAEEKPYFADSREKSAEPTSSPPSSPPTTDSHPGDGTGGSASGSSAPESRSMPRLHDGFYARASLGFGGFVDDLETRVAFLSTVTGNASGGSVASLLAVGYTLGKIIAIGGVLGTESVTDPVVMIDGQSVPSDISVGTLILFGGFVDWYPDAEAGWHIMGGAGGTSIRTEDANGTQQPEQPVGGGGFLGGGYDLRIADEWSAGVLGRATAATLHGERVRHSVVAVSVQASILFQ